MRPVSGLQRPAHLSPLMLHQGFIKGLSAVIGLTVVQASPLRTCHVNTAPSIKLHSLLLRTKFQVLGMLDGIAEVRLQVGYSVQLLLWYISSEVETDLKFYAEISGEV